MMRKFTFLIIGLSAITEIVNSFDLFAREREFTYKYTGSVVVGAQSQDEDLSPPDSSGWRIEGLLKLQRINQNFMAAKLMIDKIVLTDSSTNRELPPEADVLQLPFKIAFSNDVVSFIIFKRSDPIWSTNLKKAIASALQVQGEKDGAYVVMESGLFGQCTVDYFITNKTDYLSVKKTPEPTSCIPFQGGIDLSFTKSNVPINSCDTDAQQSVVTGSETVYGLKPAANGFYLSVAHVKGLTMVQTFESTGEAQHVTSEMLLSYISDGEIKELLDIETGMSQRRSELLYTNPKTNTENTKEKSDNLVKLASELLDSLADSYEDSNLKFEEPYESTAAEILKVMGEMDLESLQKLYVKFDIGTSYRQETARNLFLEMIPRVGTKSSVLLVRDLIINKFVKPTTAVQLLISLPFYVSEFSSGLVQDCESLLSLGPDRPDVKQAAVLSFATLVHNTFAAGFMTADNFERYVKRYFDSFLSYSDYEQQMLYLAALGNLQLGKVVEYLEPIIKDPTQSSDIRFLAVWVTMALAPTRPEKVYETYWPIFESRTNSLQLRSVAFTMLLISNPTPARLMSLHRVMQNEPCPHMINFYRTTVLSMSKTTHSCLQHMKRLLSYISRHLPPAPQGRYWVTGNYIYDQKDTTYGISTLLQFLLIGDQVSDMPLIGIFKMQSEALGRFTGDVGLYVKGRGIPDEMVRRYRNSDFTFTQLTNLFESMKLPVVSSAPLHFEFILQINGKSVLSYYMNESTFHNLTSGNIMTRADFLLLGDSHINMQTVRWPFMSKYSVPTILGTSSEVMLQSTVTTTLRGNTTQNISGSSFSRSNHIEFRYSSYSVCQSLSYNPIMKLEHLIQREQGFLVHMPISSDITLNLGEKSFKFSFYRPENTTNGIAVKSRTVTKTISDVASDQSYRSVVNAEVEGEIMELLNLPIDDLGISLVAQTNNYDLSKFVDLIGASSIFDDFSLNTDDDTVFNVLLDIVGLIQLNTIHIGHNKHFTFLLKNKESSFIEVAIYANYTEQILITEKPTQFTITLEHKQTPDGAALNAFEFKFNNNGTEEDGKTRTQMSLHRKKHLENYNICINSIQEPLIFIKRGGYAEHNISFNSIDCPNEKPNIIIRTEYDISSLSKIALLSIENNKNLICSEDVLKLNPPPQQTKYCNKKTLSQYTMISEYELDVKFNEMPDWFDTVTQRLDQGITALLPGDLTPLKLNESVRVSFLRVPNEDEVSLMINGRNFEVFDFLQVLNAVDDVKFETREQTLIDTGLLRMCSLVKDSLSSFDDKLINIKEYLKDVRSNCSILLAADCSERPEFGVFLQVSSNTTLYSIQVFSNGQYLTFTPLNDGTIQLEYQGQCFVVTNGLLETHFVRDKMKAKINAEGILVVGTQFVEIEFDLKNIFSIKISPLYKRTMCGLCSLPLNELSEYVFCGDRFQTKC